MNKKTQRPSKKNSIKENKKFPYKSRIKKEDKNVNNS